MTTRSSTASETKRKQRTLEAKLRDLLAGSPARDELCIDAEPDSLDRVRSNSDRDMAVQLLNQDARLIREIRSAIGRIKEGTYGLCAQCEEPIPSKRLDAVPWARCCVSCQAAAESATQGPTPVFKHAA